MPSWSIALKSDPPSSPSWRHCCGSSRPCDHWLIDQRDGGQSLEESGCHHSFGKSSGCKAGFHPGGDHLIKMKNLIFYINTETSKNFCCPSTKINHPSNHSGQTSCDKERVWNQDTELSKISVRCWTGREKKIQIRWIQSWREVDTGICRRIAFP